MEWKEGRTHTTINRLYHDIICPDECERNVIEGPFGFMYCEYCKYGFKVCTYEKGALHKYGAVSWDSEEERKRMIRE